MPIVRTNNKHYSDIAEAIRYKNGKTTLYKPSAMANAIRAIGLSTDDNPTNLYPISITPTGDRFVEYPEDGMGFSEVIIKGDPNLIPENIPIGVTIYGVEGRALLGAQLPDEYVHYVEYARNNLYEGDFANLMVLDYSDWIAISFLMSDFEIVTYNSSTTEFTATGWFTCGYTKTTGQWTATDFTNSTSTGGNYIRHIKYASCYIYHELTLLYPSSGGSGSSYCVTTEPVTFTLYADGWNGTTYTLDLSGYTISPSMQMGVPPTSSMYNADIVVKCAMTIPQIGGSAAYISAITAPTVDVQIAIWGLSQ